MTSTEPELQIRPSEVMGKVCGACQFWKPYISGAAYGDCDRIGTGLDGSPMAAIVAREPAVLTTRAIFGCALWEESR